MKDKIHKSLLLCYLAVKNTTLWRFGVLAVTKLWNWIDDRTGISALIKPLLFHPVPPESKWWYVFGSATLFALIVQLITGVALATVYVPSAGQAYESVRFITEDAPLGRLVRGMHYFGASAMVLFLGIHMVRVYLMASYKYPREVNWLTGVGLLALTIVMGFTGQLLRWDQNAVWSSIVGAEQALRTPIVGSWLARIFISGGNIGGSTLSHFFVLHVFVVPGLLVAVMGLHLHLVLRNGISEPPVVGQPVNPATYRTWYHAMLERVGLPFWPCAAWRDAVFGSAVIVGIVVCAWIFGPPALDKSPDISVIEAQPKPDWYLLWYFAVMALLPHAIEDYVMLLAPLCIGGALLAVPFLSNAGERSWRRRPWAPLLVVFALTCIIVLWIEGTREDWSPKFSSQPLSEKIIGISAGPVHAGGLVFNQRGCLYCHTIADQGGKRGPNLSDVGNRLIRDQIIISILKGGTNMPAYANNLTPQELDEVVEFLLSRKTSAP